MHTYFDAKVTDQQLRSMMPTAVTNIARFDARNVRRYLVKRGFKPEYIVRYAYRPFDNRWLYWEPETKLLDEKRSEYFSQLSDGNLWLEARQRQPMEKFDRGYVTKFLADNFGNGLSTFFPLYLRHQSSSTPNISRELDLYLSSIKSNPEPFFMHCVAVLHSPNYRRENSAALRIDWPHVPIPHSKEILEAVSAVRADYRRATRSGRCQCLGPHSRTDRHRRHLSR
jgi:predicted helicase